MSDLISREAAIKTFREELDGGYVLTNDAQTTRILQSIPAADASEWIAVGDKLPDLHDEVWDASGEIVHYKISDPCLCVFNGEEMIVAAYEIDSDIDFGGWASCFDSGVLHSVTHWRPLPKLPNE